MNKSLKIAIGSIIGFLLILLLIQYFQLKSSRKTNQIQAIELMNANDTAKIYKDKTGQLYSVLKAVTTDAVDLKNQLSAFGLENKELKAKDIKWKNITSALKAELAMKGHDTIPLHDTVYIDTLNVLHAFKSYTWTNHFLSLSGIIRDKTMDVDYSYKVGMTFVTEPVGKATKVTAWLLDPKASIITGSEIVVSHKTKWYEKPWVWGIAGAVGGYYLGK